MIRLLVLTTLTVILPITAIAQLPGVFDEPITAISVPIEVNPRRVALGAALFADARLSGDRMRSCVSCHNLKTNGATARPRDRAPNGMLLDLNTSTVFNATLSFRLNWFGNARTLEEQAAGAIEAHDKMGADAGHVVEALRADPATVQRFVAAYGHGPDWTSLLDALAAFERTLVTPGCRFDLWLGGDRAAITTDELAGYKLFKSVGCVSCHQGVNVGGNLFERMGVADLDSESDRRMLRVPSLRNVAATPPYFHDGSASNLEAAIHRMAAAQLGRELTDLEVASIAAFLRTLTGRYDGQAIVAP